MLISTLSPYFVKRDSTHTTKCPHVRFEGEFASVLAKFDRRQLMEVSAEHLQLVLSVGPMVDRLSG